MPTYPDVQLERWSMNLTNSDDLTEFVTTLSWSNATSAPYGSIEAVLAIPRRAWSSRMPQLGDWLVVRDRSTTKALQWGYVVLRNTGVVSSARGHVTTSQTSISTISWYDLLGRLSIYAHPGIEGRWGTIMSTSRWSSGPWAALLELIDERFLNRGKRIPGLNFGSKRKVPGYALSLLLAEIPQLQIPVGQTVVRAGRDKQGMPVIAGSYANMAEAVRVVYDEKTASAYAPERVVEAVPGYRLDSSVFELAAVVRDTSIQDIINSTFMADVSMVEMFPSLEDPGKLELSGDPRDSVAQLALKQQHDAERSVLNGTMTHPAFDRGVLSAMAELDFLAKDINRGKELEKHILASASVPEYTSPTAAQLGANPVLIYRMRPWRVLSITDMLKHQLGTKSTLPVGRGFISKVVEDELSEGFEYDRDTFDGSTWDGANAVTIPADHIVSITMGVTDEQHINAVTVGLPFLPDSPTGLMTRLGLPLLQRASIERRGVRMYRPLWPFMPPSARTDEPMMSFMRSIAMMAAQLMMNSDRFESGAIQGKYMPWVRHGEPISVELPFGSPNAESQPLTSEPGRMTAYAERVTHTVSVDAQGSITGTTVVDYTRGLFDELDRIATNSFYGVGGQRGWTP